MGQERRETDDEGKGSGVLESTTTTGTRGFNAKLSWEGDDWLR